LGFFFEHPQRGHLGQGLVLAPQLPLQGLDLLLLGAQLGALGLGRDRRIGLQAAHPPGADLLGVEPLASAILAELDLVERRCPDPPRRDMLARPFGSYFMSPPLELVAQLRTARDILVLTGAGVSQESGIPTFRDAQTGLWARFNAEQLATSEAFDANPALVWGWYEWRRGLTLRAAPNAAHRAIAALSGRVPSLTLVTQNVDGLHERAGSPAVVRLHGSLHHPYCAACGAPHFLEGTPDPREDGGPLDPPACRACGGRVRPGVVWFGETLPAGSWNQALVAAERCDLLLSVGTSSLVYPAATLPELAARHGATVVQVNPAPTPLDDLARFTLRGTAAELLPQLLAAAWPD
jgi:NAD-dependent deacetylase